MLGPFKCSCCGEVFNEPRVVRETHGFTDGFAETFYVCPYCGGDYDDYDSDEEVDDDC